MENEPLRQSRKPVSEESQLKVEGNVPQVFKDIVAKQRGEANTPAQAPREYPPAMGPRLGFTGDPKLDELLAGIKEAIRYEEIMLPSMGKFYDGNQAPKSGILHIRPMTGEEQRILGTPRFVKKGQAMNMIFQNCIQEPINPEKLLTVDRTLLLIYLRAISYSTEYEVEVKCPACATKFSTTLDLDSLAIDRCPNDFGVENLVDVLPTTGYKFSYRFPTAEDDQKVNVYRDRRMKMFGDQATDDTWNYRTALLINDIEGLTDKESLKALIGRLPINDVSHLSNVVNDPPFGMETKMQIICASCSEEFEIEMPMEASFFFPRRKKENRTQA